MGVDLQAEYTICFPDGTFIEPISIDEHWIIEPRIPYNPNLAADCLYIKHKKVMRY